MAKQKRNKAYKKVERMRRYGTRRVKTLLRQWEDCDVLTLVGIVKQLGRPYPLLMARAQAALDGGGA